MWMCYMWSFNLVAFILSTFAEIRLFLVLDINVSIFHLFTLTGNTIKYCQFLVYKHRNVEAAIMDPILLKNLTR